MSRSRSLLLEGLFETGLVVPPRLLTLPLPVVSIEEEALRRRLLRENRCDNGGDAGGGGGLVALSER